MIALMIKQIGKRQEHRDSSTLYAATAAELFSVNPIVVQNRMFIVQNAKLNCTTSSKIQDLRSAS